MHAMNAISPDLDLAWRDCTLSLQQCKARRSRDKAQLSSELHSMSEDPETADRNFRSAYYKSLGFKEGEKSITHLEMLLKAEIFGKKQLSSQLARACYELMMHSMQLATNMNLVSPQQYWSQLHTKPIVLANQHCNLNQCSSFVHLYQ